MTSSVNLPFIIGLTGPARSGKDTVANYLVKRHDFQAVAFADPLRAMLAKGFDLQADHFQALKEEPLPWLGLSPRHLLQTLGTEWGRSLHPNIWILLMEQRLNNYTPLESRIVVTDVRFENEADWVRKHGVLWHIHRDVTLRPSLPDTTASHSSEKGVVFLPGDRFISNNRSIEDLHQEVKVRFNQLSL